MLASLVIAGDMERSKAVECSRFTYSHIHICSNSNNNIIQYSPLVMLATSQYGDLKTSRDLICLQLNFLVLTKKPVYVAGLPRLYLHTRQMA